MTWTYEQTSRNGVPVFRVTSDRGELREWTGGFDAFMEDRDFYAATAHRVAEALGPDTLRRWMQADTDLDLAAEVKSMADRVRDAAMHLQHGMVEASAALQAEVRSPIPANWRGAGSRVTVTRYVEQPEPSDPEQESTDGR